MPAMLAVSGIIYKVKYDMILFEKIFCYFVNTFIFAVPKRELSIG
jgi:hypothetical protein